MHDGNKEATKELLSTFRTISATALSIVLLATNFQIRGQLVVKNGLAYYTSVAALVLVVVLCFVLFLITIPKLFDEENGIPYQWPLKVVGGSAMLAFVVGSVLIVVSQL